MENTNFKQVESAELFDADLNKVRWVVLRNPDNKLEHYGVVTSGYKMISHTEVYTQIAQTLEEQKMNHTITWKEINSEKGVTGARIHFRMMLHDKFHTIGGDKVVLRCSFDNSYDSTTGLRLEVGAFIQRTEADLYVTELVSDKLNTYYHRHTKGLVVGELSKTMAKGIEVFMTSIRQEFEDLLNTSVSQSEVVAWIQELIQKKSCKATAKKYLESIETVLKRGSVHNLWDVYSMISSVCTKEIESIDVRRNASREMLSKMKKRFPKTMQIVVQESSDETLGYQVA